MATLRRGLVDKMKKAAAKVSTRGAEVAAKAGTRGARALVETTVAAVKTVDKIQEKLGRHPKKPRSTEMLASRPPAESISSKAAAKTSTKVPAATSSKPRRATAERSSEAQPVMLREAGRKTMPAAAPKRSKQAQAPGFKVKRGQKHRHTGR